MKKEHEEELIKLCPRLYKENGSHLLFGFDCRDGWFSLIKELSLKLEEMINKISPHNRADHYASVVKEKLGILRFYMLGTLEMYSLIHEYENKSAFVCEECGEPGKHMRDKNWLYTACEEHKRASS